MSVPNQYAAEGHLSRRIGAKACGSMVPRKGANTAIAVINSSSTLPTTIVGCRRIYRRVPLSRAGAGRVRSLWMMAMTVASIPDARVEQRVAQIDQQIDQHIGGREYE